MKKIFHIILVIFIVQACSGINESSESKGSTESKTRKEGLDQYSNTPKFCVAELLELLKLNPDKFENHLLSKGFEFFL